MQDKHLLVVAGPTASGKTALSIRLAQHFGTEIINADSRQIYKEMTIGTAKPTTEELNAAPHHFVGFLSVAQTYNAGMFEKDALALLDKLFARHNLVVLSGGSGLYVKAVCQGMDEMPTVQEGMRNQLNKELAEKGLPTLLAELAEKDPDYFQKVDRQNPQRVVRALEVARSTGKPYSAFRKQNTPKRPFRLIKIGLEWERETLYARIDQRMNQMLAEGLVEEARQLYPQRHLNALQTVGYSEVFDFFDGKYDYPEMVRLLKRNSRRYAKRQLTWFRKEPGIQWLHPTDWHSITHFIHQEIASNI